ncbi:DNA-3-methyladenine glycosylase family protein [Bacillus salitolerans]|uniref:DNA-3-methyladenine glycosylase II n=1 Tax=Bacillus salitolerans TaxID=1437434 RepID=A0ABW4LS94_9BACI
MWTETVITEGPYRFESVLHRLTLDPLNQIDLEANTIRIPMYVHNHKQVVTIKGVGTIEAPEFEVTSDQYKEETLNEVARIFQWNVSLKEMAKHFEATNIAKLAKDHEGTPLVLDMNPYLSLLKCIIHQQLNMSFAFTLTKRLVQTYGEEVDGVWFYPLPEKVASLAYSELRDMQFSQRKAEYVIDTSRLLAEGQLSLDELVTMNDEEIQEKLMKIRGIGQWTIQNLLLFGFGRQNLFPKADIGIQNAIKKHFNLDQKPTYEQMDELSKGWSPYLSYASLYLWRSLETKQ